MFHCFSCFLFLSVCDTLKKRNGLAANSWFITPWGDQMILLSWCFLFTMQGESQLTDTSVRLTSLLLVVPCLIRWENTFGGLEPIWRKLRRLPAEQLGHMNHGVTPKAIFAHCELYQQDWEEVLSLFLLLVLSRIRSILLTSPYYCYCYSWRLAQIEGQLSTRNLLFSDEMDEVFIL